MKVPTSTRRTTAALQQARRTTAARNGALLLWWFLVLSLCATLQLVSGSSGSLSTPASARTEHHHQQQEQTLEGIPRSHNSRAHSPISSRRSVIYNPPWNPSRNIFQDGFLKALYSRIPGIWEQDVRLRTSVTLDEPCRIRQVPGDGNCLFHSISVGLCHAVNKTQWDMKSDESLSRLYEHSQLLRQQAVACLRDSNRRLCLQGREWVRARELVEAAAQQYGLTAEEYCQEMQQESVWGGGPEIVALANTLKRPIHVYELTTTTAVPAKKRRITSTVSKNKPAFVKATVGASSSSEQQKQVFVLRRMACFGSPRFDRCGDPALHILSADSRFPDLDPGQQLKDGNHFLAVFPVEEDDEDDDGRGQRRRRKKRLRGGSSLFSAWADDDEEDDRSDGAESYSLSLDDEVDDVQEQEEQLVATRGTQNREHEFRWMGGWWRRNV